MKKKFEIRQNGVKYHPSTNNMVVMNSEGVFFLVCTETYYQSIRKLSDSIGNYDVVWKEEE
jgi:hypothetical protein